MGPETNAGETAALPVSAPSFSVGDYYDPQTLAPTFSNPIVTQKVGNKFRTTAEIDLNSIQDKNVIDINGTKFEFDTDGVLENPSNISVDISNPNNLRTKFEKRN